MKNAGTYGFLLLIVAVLPGCASIVSGMNQPVTVEARSQGASLAGAKCKLVNDKGTWYTTTPGSVTVHRSLADLQLTCEKDDGMQGASRVKSSTKAMAFGNAIFGGLVGVGVDIASGAAFDYPNLILVEMTGRGQTGPGAAAAVVPAQAAVQPTVAPGASTPALPQNAPAPVPSYPRPLTGEELSAHFQRVQVMDIRQGRPFTLKHLGDGKVERDCPSCKSRAGHGTVELRTAEGLACFNWYNVSFPESGCYRVMQTGPDEYSLSDDLANLHYRYAGTPRVSDPLPR